MSVGTLPAVSLWVTTENDAFIVRTCCRTGLFQQPEDVCPNNRVCVNSIHSLPLIDSN